MLVSNTLSLERCGVDEIDRSEHRRTRQSHCGRRAYSYGDCLSHIWHDSTQQSGWHPNDILVNVTLFLDAEVKGKGHESE